MKKNQFVLSAILFISLVAGYTGIKWGVPSNIRADMVLPKELRTEEFYKTMADTRSDIYKATGGNPLGRLQEDPGQTPILKTMNVPSTGNVVLEQNDRVFANLIRPYLLRTNHPDEQMAVNMLSLMKPSKLDFNPRLFQYGGVYIYPMGAYLEALKILNIIHVSGNIDYYMKNPSEMGNIFYYGRLVNIVFLLITVIFVYLTSNELYGGATALLSALLVSVAPALIFQTHIMKPYILSNMFTSMCLYFSAKMFKHPDNTKNAALSGITMGLVSGSMLVYSTMITIPLLACVFSKKNIIKNMILILLLSAAVFAVTNPYAFIDSTAFLREMTASKGVYVAGMNSGWLRFFSGQLPYYYNHIFIVAAFLSTAFVMRTRKKEDLFLVFTALLHLLLMSYLLRNQKPSMHFTRFLLPSITLFSILVASVFHRLRGVSSLKYSFTTAFVILTSSMCLQSAVVVRNFYVDSTPNSTRLSAGRWITENVPQNTLIGIIGLPEPSTLPPISYSRYKLMLIRDLKVPANTLPNYLIINTELAGEYEHDAKVNFKLLKEFKPAESFAGLSFELLSSHVNTKISIYGKNREGSFLRQP